MSSLTVGERLIEVLDEIDEIEKIVSLQESTNKSCKAIISLIHARESIKISLVNLGYAKSSHDLYIRSTRKMKMFSFLTKKIEKTKSKD